VNEIVPDDAVHNDLEIETLTKRGSSERSS